MLFGTSGIRGDAQKLFNNQFCFDIGRSFSKFLENYGIKGKMAIGMDPRESSQRIKYAIIAGLLYEGRKVFDEGIAPSPAMNYILIADPNIAGSIMITGSHIRSDFNGTKFFAFKKEISKENEKEIETIYEEIKEKVAYKEENVIGKKVRCCNRANKLYQDMLMNLVDDIPKCKIVLDLGNGCQSKIMPGLFQKLGIETIIINGNPQPKYFIARDTETDDAVQDLQEKVKEVNADLGIAFDGDGDRVVFVDEDGKFIPGDYSGALIAKYSDTPFVVVPINVSQVVEHIGKPVIITKVGSPYVVKAIEENGATFGFEANGGCISKEIMLSRDAGSATIKILNILKDNNKTLKELIGEFPQLFISRAKIDCPTNIYPIIFESVKNKFKGITEDIDGIKIWKDDDSWLLFRPSTNAPEFRVFAEANNGEYASKLCKEGIEFVTSIRDANIGNDIENTSNMY